MQDAATHTDDPHDDAFADASEDPEFTNEAAWLEAGTARRGQPFGFAVPTSEAALGSARFSVDWMDAHREATYPADPAYLNGVAIDVALDAPKACRVQLSYPALRCGLYVITCRQCAFSIAVATAGRADDPCSVRVPCRA